MSASYTHDFADREVSLEVTSPGGTETVVSAATYLPSGPLSSLALGSGTTETRAFDGRYAPTAISLEGPAERTFAYTTDPVGNVLEIVEQSGCTPGPIVLEAETVTTEESVVSCSTIEAGNGYAVESPGDVSFHAQETIALTDGFSVGDGARFTAGSGGLPELSRRTYTYQSPQYFLTGAEGPWGELSWSYDRIGNRLTETRDGATDTYQYLTNGDGGNTPTLDQVALAVGGTRDYTYGPAGHLEKVAPGANVIDFAADSEGRLSGASRTAANVSAALSYDGRSFLTRAVETTDDPPAEAASVEAVYDSFGFLRALRRKPNPSDPEELVIHFYFAARPIAQVAIDGGGTETWTYLTPDHLGTPLLVTDDAGAVTWEGGLEPFGRDYQAGTPAGALENGLYLRLPGQWLDRAWTDATSGAVIAYNVARWLEPGTGYYTRGDPLGLRFGERPYLYARGNPLTWLDPLGLQAVPPLPGRRDPFVPPFPLDFPSGPWGDRPDPNCCDEEKVDQRVKKAGLLAEGKEVVEIHGADSTVRGWRHEGGPWLSPVPPTQPFERPCTEADPCVNFCCNVHEYYHYGNTRWINMNWNQQILHNHQETPAYGVEQACLRSFLSGG